MKTIATFFLVFTAYCTGYSSAEAQLFVGAGPVYSLPQGTFADVNKPSVGGTAFVGSRKYCNLWTGLRLDYIPYSVVDDATSLISYGDAVMLSPEFRYFFKPATEFPVYLQGMMIFSGIKGTDNASRTGLGAGAGIGGLLFYDTNCAGWFIDGNVRYMAPNLLRADARPSLNAINASISINFGL
ncbi:MAG: hypothetical protein V4642_16370 [Bacteroidota bacterium]